MGRKTIDLIDRRHMMGILLFLLDNGSSLKTEIYNDVSRNSNMSVRIDDLEDIGLVSHVVTFRGFIYALTPKGRRVAELLRSVETVLERGQRCLLSRG